MAPLFFQRYKEWVKRNNSLLSVWEIGLSSLTWLLPDRFSESELTLEAIHTAINLISTFHDSIINEGPAGDGGPRGAELVFLLGALQQVQVLLELGAVALEQRGRGNRYDPLAAVEGLKALLRMLILYRSKARILTNGGITSFEQQWAAGGMLAGAYSPEARAHQVVDAFAQFRSRHCKLGGPGLGGQQQQQQPARLGLSKLGCCTSGSSSSSGSGGSEAQEGSSLSGYWWQGTGHGGPSAPIAGSPSAHSGGSEADARGSERAARAAECWAERRQALAMRMIVAAELLHILRPLLYTLALRRWGRQSWRPFLSSLAVDLLSWQLTSGGAGLSQSTAQRASANPALKGSSAALLQGLQGIRWSSEERDELTRRRLLLAYYLLRDPVFARYTGPALARWRALVGRLPLAGRLADKAVEILMGMQSYYTYTAAS